MGCAGLRMALLWGSEHPRFVKDRAAPLDVQAAAPHGAGGSRPLLSTQIYHASFSMFYEARAWLVAGIPELSIHRLRAKLGSVNGQKRVYVLLVFFSNTRLCGHGGSVRGAASRARSPQVVWRFFFAPPSAGHTQPHWRAHTELPHASRR